MASALSFFPLFQTKRVHNSSADAAFAPVCKSASHLQLHLCLELNLAQSQALMKLIKQAKGVWPFQRLRHSFTILFMYLSIAIKYASRCGHSAAYMAWGSERIVLPQSEVTFVLTCSPFSVLLEFRILFWDLDTGARNWAESKYFTIDKWTEIGSD